MSPDLKVGAIVWLGDEDLGTVERLTTTQVVVRIERTRGEARYHRETGKPVGGGRLDRLRLATPDEVDLFRARQRVARLSDQVHRKFVQLDGGIARRGWRLPLEQLQRVEAAMHALLTSLQEPE